VGSATDFASGSFFLGFHEDWTIPCCMICGSLVIHAVQRSILALTSALPSARVAASRVVAIFSGVKGHVSIFRLWRPKIFLLVF
jgi:hypothetical protein